MKRDLHYYALLAFCRSCGFDKNSSRIIAYASQFVDDAKINLITINNPKPGIDFDMINGKPALFNMATCHAYFRIKNFNYEAMVNNTCAFHFVPGCEGNSFTKKLRCKEESPVIMDILSQALHDHDLIKLGMVLHAYADTFSHQGFSGLLSKVNDIDKCEAYNEVYLGPADLILYFLKQVFADRFDEIFDRIVPAYGHGQALSLPDLPYLIWSYEYDYSEKFHGAYRATAIDNRERYQRAFLNIKGYLGHYLTLHPQYADPQFRFVDGNILFERLIQKGSDDKREKAWIDMMIEQGIFEEKDIQTIIYCENDWLTAAFTNFDVRTFNNRHVSDGQITENFEETHWYHFCQAVKWYKESFFESCREHALFIPK